MERFELDEAEVVGRQKRAPLISRIAAICSSVFHIFNDSVVSPIMKAVDPFREGLAYLDRAYELVVVRVGNPLVVKRLLYVTFVVVLMNSLYFAERNDSIKGVSGGGFTDGKLFDIDLLTGNLGHYIDPLTIKENIEYLSSVARFPGSVGDLATARYVQSYFSNNGIKNPHIDEERVYLNYPRADGTYLKMADGSFEATLSDGPNDNIQNLAFNPNALGTHNEIEAPYVFVNYGGRSDFMRLSESGVSLDGCILLVKYGGPFPEPMKLRLAQQYGAHAIVFISPSTEWQGVTSDEFIAKIDMANSRYSGGDILDPQWTAQRDSQPNEDWNASAVTPKIPLIPISWKDGLFLIDQLKSGIQFEDGPYSGTRHDSKPLKLSINIQESKHHPIWNVVGTIKGREQAGKAIIFGAARDSTCHGASTSATGTAVLLELVRLFTSLQRQYDWSPSRTMYFVSFDATDYNVAGSTLWINKGKKEILEQGYAYVDLGEIHLGDVLSIAANPLLHTVILEELSKVTLDSSKFDNARTLFELYTKQHGGKNAIPNCFLVNKNYVPFINNVNIPAVDVGFRNPDHKTEPLKSCLDLFNHVDTFSGQMEHQVALVEFLARFGLRMAEEPLIPYDFNHFANQLVAYKDDLQKTIDEHPAMKGLSLSDLNRGISKFMNGAQNIEEFKQEWKDFLKSSGTMEPVMLGNTRRYINENVVAFNRLFVSSEGRSLRPGYANFLTGVSYFAPQSSSDDYQWNSFPFVRDAILIEDTRAALTELERLGITLSEGAALLMTYG